MPEDHWHVNSQIDMNSFVEAAVYVPHPSVFASDPDLKLNPLRYEEQQVDESAVPHPSSRRQLIHFPRLSPRLGVLNNIPFAIPFETRVLIFRRFVQSDIINRGIDHFGPRGRTEASIRRTNIAEDGYDRLSDVDLRAPISITFIDQFGEPE